MAISIQIVDNRTMEIELGDEGKDPTMYITVKRHGIVVGEIAYGRVQDAAELWKEVTRARRLKQLNHLVRGLVREILRDRVDLEGVKNSTPEKRKAAFFVGLQDGLLSLKAPDKKVDGLPYREGYSEGKAIVEAVARVIELDNAED